MPKTYEELLKALQPEQAEIFTKHVNELLVAKDNEIEKLNTEVTTLKSQVETLSKSAPKQNEEEDVLKNASPEIRELLKKQQATIDKLVANQAEDLAKSRFEKCKAIPCEEATLKEVLKTASPAVVSILEKAASAIEEKVLTAKGKDTDPAFVGDSSAEQYAKLEKSANKIMAENEGMTFEQAFCKATEADPETYRKYTEGVL